MDELNWFWWSYFLNNISLLDGLLRLVCLLIVHQYIATSLAGCRYIFWWHMFFYNSFYIALRGAPINCFFWTFSSLFLQTFLPINYFFWTSSFLLLRTFLLMNSISLSFDSWIFDHLLATSYNISHKFLISSQFLEKFMEILEWSTLQK